jgi:NADPH:quinone reductase-like Zn-dependent oxidoreductase
MKVVLLERNGPPEVLQSHRDSDRVTPAADDVVVKVRFSLEQLADAIHHVETGQKIGNVVLTIGG